MSGHTPGKWFVDMTYQWPSKVRSDAFPDKWICDAAGPGGGDTEPLANARLIAAAPDLLEALKRLTHGLPDLLESIGYQDEERLIEEALAVIARAETDHG